MYIYIYTYIYACIYTHLYIYLYRSEEMGRRETKINYRKAYTQVDKSFSDS